MWPALLERWIQINSCLGSNAPDPFQPDARKHDSNKVFLTMRRVLWSHVCVFTQIIYFLHLSSGWIKGIISFGFQLSGGDISLAAAHSSPECTIEDVRALGSGRDVVSCLRRKRGLTALLEQHLWALRPEELNREQPSIKTHHYQTLHLAHERCAQACRPPCYNIYSHDCWEIYYSCLEKQAMRYGSLEKTCIVMWSRQNKRGFLLVWR